MRKKSFCFSFCLIILLLISSTVWAWDDEKTHRTLTSYATNKSTLSIDHTDYLTGIGFKKHLEDILLWSGHHCDDNTKKANCNVVDWLKYGAEKEDEDRYKNPVTGRYRNHFHNPIDGEGLHDFYIPIDGIEYAAGGESALEWAQDGTEQSKWVEGDQSWHVLRLCYWHALTAESEEERQAWYATLFKGLGHQMHLVQDMAVPTHVRNDSHPLETSPGRPVDPKRIPIKTPRYFEYWAKKSDTFIISSMAADAAVFSSVSFDRYYAGDEPYGVVQSPVSQLWDAQVYDGTNPSADTDQGLSEYTNANFFSDSTIFAAERLGIDDKHYFPYPDSLSVDFTDPIIEIATAEDGLPGPVVYWKKVGNGETIDHFVAQSYLNAYVSSSLPEKWDTFFLDEACHYDYAEKLVPRAVGYSADLLDYFFRGRLRIQSLPIFHDNTLESVRLNITNITPYEEAMTDGTFVLTLRYTPDGAKEDGSEDIFVTADADRSCDELLSNETLEVYFYPLADSLLIPIDHWDNVKATLTFYGKLGSETNAVVGKVFKPGTVLFNEEWDRSLLDGYYDWFGTGEWTTENYACTQTVSDGQFVMQLDEYEGDGEASCDLFYDFANDGLLVTEKTVLEVLVNEMSTNPVEGAEGHDMILMFNLKSCDDEHYDNYRLMYTIDGPYRSYAAPWTEGCDAEARKTLQAGVILGEDLQGAFARSGITIPDPLYLKQIGFEQHLYESDEDNHLRTVVDYIRIVEMGDE